LHEANRDTPKAPIDMKTPRRRLFVEDEENEVTRAAVINILISVAEVSTTSFFVNNILLYINNVYLCSRRPGEERGTGPPPPTLGSYISESRLQCKAS